MTMADNSTLTFSSCQEEEEDYPKTLQEELNEILEAWYSLVSEDEIRLYQKLVEDIMDKRIAEGALDKGDEAPDFELTDQDGEKVNMRSLLGKGPVVVVFYRGKWCPHCNATILRMQEIAPQIHAKGATLVAISPMLPDGTQYLATKKSLEFLVCSDLGNDLARRYNITFNVMPEVRDKMVQWGEDIPAHNGDDSWEIPLPATYVVDESGTIVWSFVDNDPSVRAEPQDILDAIPTKQSTSVSNKKTGMKLDDNHASGSRRRGFAVTFKKAVKKTLWGKRRQTASQFLGGYFN